MTTNHEFDRQLADWLDETSAHRVPDHMLDVLLVTRGTRQRPWWSSPERWLPMDLTTRVNTLVTPRISRPLLVGLLILVIAALAILAVGSRQRTLPPPFGPAKNGAITFATGGDIFALDSIDATPRLLIGGTTGDFAPGFSRDGTQLGFLRDTHATGGFGVGLMVADADGSHVRQLIDLIDGTIWSDPSPDGSAIAFAGTYGGLDGIFLLNTAGTAAPARLDLGVKSVSWLNWRPPVGRELLYIDANAGDFRLYGVARGGSGRHLIKDLGVLNENTKVNLDPNVSPDGRSLVYAVQEGDFFRNHLVDLDTGADRALSLGPAGHHELHGQFSPDGTKLLFHGADNIAPKIQEMLGPLDGSTPAIPIGPPYPIIDGSAELNQTFSPDGRTIVIIEGRGKQVRLVDATTGGVGRVVSWLADDLPGWQRLAP
jgi:Tol biopolymer transport system component